MIDAGQPVARPVGPVVAEKGAVSVTIPGNDQAVARLSVVVDPVSALAVRLNGLGGSYDQRFAIQ